MDVSEFNAPAAAARLAGEMHVCALDVDHGLEKLRTTLRASLQGTGEQMISFAPSPQRADRLRVRHLASFRHVDHTTASRHSNRATGPNVDSPAHLELAAPPCPAGTVTYRCGRGPFGPWTRPHCWSTMKGVLNGRRSMTEHPNVRLIQHGYDEFAHGDLEALREFMAPDVVWHEPGRSPLAGDYKGPEGVLMLLGDLRARSDGTFTAARCASRASVEIVELPATGQRAVAIQEATGRRGDRALDMASAVEFEIHQGKITEVTVYHADTYHFDEFWS
jgi:ketosteroid isomerase-like protein